MDILMIAALPFMVPFELQQLKDTSASWWVTGVRRKQA